MNHKWPLYFPRPAFDLFSSQSNSTTNEPRIDIWVQNTQARVRSLVLISVYTSGSKAGNHVFLENMQHMQQWSPLVNFVNRSSWRNVDWICCRFPFGSMSDPRDKQGRTVAGHSQAAVTTGQVQKLVAESIQVLEDSILAMFGNRLE